MLKRAQLQCKILTVEFLGMNKFEHYCYEKPTTTTTTKKQEQKGTSLSAKPQIRYIIPFADLF